MRILLATEGYAAVGGTETYVGDHALVREGARLGTSAAVGHGCTVSRDVKIGDRTRLQSFVVLGARWSVPARW
jgi:UDP-3-O-[3-hydroxymyristoyl] glucosamine N-acyltransferase